MTTRSAPHAPSGARVAAPLHTRVERRTHRDRRVLVGVLGLAVLSLVGAWISVAGGLSDDVWEAMGPTGRLSIPIPMMVAQVVVAWVASGTRRRPALLA